MAKNKSHQRPPFATIDQTFEALKDETDRGTVLICSQWLQDSIESLLRTYFLGTADASEAMLDDILSGERLFAPLSRSLPRLWVCRALGLLGDSACDAVTAVQLLRNRHFAHYIGVAKLSDDHAKGPIDELVAHVSSVFSQEFLMIKSQLDARDPGDGSLHEQWKKFIASWAVLIKNIRARETEIAQRLPNQRCRDRLARIAARQASPPPTTPATSQ